MKQETLQGKESVKVERVRTDLGYLKATKKYIYMYILSESNQTTIKINRNN